MRTNVLLRTKLNRLYGHGYSGRVWPNGEFGLGKKKLVSGYGRSSAAIAPSPGDDDGAYREWLLSGAGDFNLSREKALRLVYPGFDSAVLGVAGAPPAMGLSDAPNSHSAPTRRKRGSLGITSHQRRMLRNGAFLLQQAVGKFKMAMLTCTVPELSPEGWKQYADSWAEIVRQFLQELGRSLVRAGCRKWIIGCSEIQEERLLESGGYPLHLHLVFQCRRGKHYAYDPSHYKDMWKRTVERFVPEVSSEPFCSACRVESIEKDAAKYISKYASKGVSGTVLDGISEGYTCPGSWAHITGGLKKLILSQVRLLSQKETTELTYWIRRAPHRFVYLGETWIDSPVGERVVAYYGELTRVAVNILRGVAKEDNASLLGGLNAGVGKHSGLNAPIQVSVLG